MNYVNKLELLKEIQMLDFALQDVTLYLDLHKKDEEAIYFFLNAKKRYTLLYKEFERKYGMLTNRSVFSSDYMTYINSPWPWEKEERRED